MKSSNICIITRSPLTSLLFKGLATKHATVKWTITQLDLCHLATSKYLSFLQLNGSINWTSYLIIKVIMMIAKAKIIIPAKTPPYNDPLQYVVPHLLEQVQWSNQLQNSEYWSSNNSLTLYFLRYMQLVAQGSVYSLRQDRVYISTLTWCFVVCDWRADLSWITSKSLNLLGEEHIRSIINNSWLTRILDILWI